MNNLEWQFLPISEFSNHIQQWNQLNKDTHNTPLLDSKFILPLLDHFSTGHEKLAVYGHIKSPDALAIIVQTRFGSWSTFQPSQAPLGCWLQNPALSIQQLANKLRKSLNIFPLVFSITQQDPDLLAPPSETRNLQTLPYIQTARVSVSGSFENYWEQRGKNLKQNLRKQRNRLEREEIKTKLVKITASKEMQSAVHAYGNLESAGWKSQQNTAVSLENSQGKFYLNMLNNFADEGKAVVYQYWYNGSLAATDLCLLDQDSLIILKTTYDENIKISSPALLMRQDVFEEVFDQQLTKRIEFYGKVMEWHTKWSNEIREMFHVNVYSDIGAVIKSLKS